VPIERRCWPSEATEGENEAGTERAEGRMPAANVRRDGTGNPELQEPKATQDPVTA
jgi:hypothetical protein